MPDQKPPEQGGSISFTVLGYEDLTEIGRGGFGVVYRASQTDFDRDVAIKVIGAVLGPSSRARFDRERRIMGSLSSHLYIVTIYDAGFTSDDRPYIAMEYMSGGSLADRRSEPMPWRDAVAIGVKVAGALEAAHRAGILHRDIKPGNILISAYGEPKLADFGIARAQGATETRSGVITATIAHAAPEIIDGQRATERSDLYSLASTIYTLIAGRPPFSREDDESIVPMYARIAKDPVPDLRSRGVPHAVCSTLEQAMAKNPSERIASAEELGKRLRDAESAAGVTPTQLTVEAPVQPDPNLTTPVDPPPLQPTPVPMSSTPPPRRRIGGWVFAAIVAAVILVFAGVVGAVVLGGGDDGDSGDGGRARNRENTATTVDPEIAAEAAADEEQYRALVDRIENVLGQSAAGRADIIDVVGRIQNCSIVPYDAAQEIRSVITNRESILTQLSSFTISDNAEANNLVSLLQTAIQESIESNRYYVQWAENAYIEGYYGVGCYDGVAPTDQYFDQAQQASGRATAAKEAFVAAFNPVAGRFGLQQWGASDF